jgi:hypothetical protein
MRVLGFNGSTISANSIGEAASIDLVLFIDTSSSMAYETSGDPSKPDIADGTSNGDDPRICNTSTTAPCKPLNDVKNVAIDFVDGDLLFFPYDRVAIVASTQQQQDGTATRLPQTIIPFSDNADTVKSAIRSLKVFVPKTCPSTEPYSDEEHGPCLRYEPLYMGQRCIDQRRDGTDADPTSCGASNIGGGIYESAYQYAYARTDSFWVAIALIGGPANAAVDPRETDADEGICPGSEQNPTWYFPSTTVNGITYPEGPTGFCRDRDPYPYSLTTATRRRVDLTDPANPVYPPNYDADDFARDAADYMSAPDPKGQGVVMFSICMGTQCQNQERTPDPASAEHLGQYMAYHAGDDLTVNPPIVANHGLYQYAEDSDDLGDIFKKISDNIFTRISQ